VSFYVYRAGYLWTGEQREGLCADAVAPRVESL
jgi:hypothetical protein